MSENEFINRLKLFNQKAEELLNSKFKEYVTTQNWGVKYIYKKGEPSKVEVRSPDKESIDAYLLTFRFFIQNNEPCSLRNIAEAYQELDIDNDIKNRFLKAREDYNNYLDSEEDKIKIKIHGRFLTRREILEIVLYGDRAHLNVEKRRIIEKMKNSEFKWRVVFAEFISILGNTLKIIYFTKELNSKILLTSKNHCMTSFKGMKRSG